MGIDLNGLLLVFLFGLRHGLAADHIAVIDGLGMHLSSREKNSMVPWLGTLFALGHGLVITIFIVVAHLGAKTILLGENTLKWLECFPVLLLFAIAFLNLRTLLRNKDPRHNHGARPKAGISKGSSLNTMLISICMIMIFDTLADAAAWGYSAASSDNFFSALWIGAVFTFGMLVTDTIDSRLLGKTIRQSAVNDKVSRQRRLLSWVIVISSFGIGLQKGLTFFSPSFELSETLNLVCGMLLIVIVAVSYFRIYRALRPAIYPSKKYS